MERSVSGHLEVALRALGAADNADQMTVDAHEQIQPMHVQNRPAGDLLLASPGPMVSSGLAPGPLPWELTSRKHCSRAVLTF